MILFKRTIKRPIPTKLSQYLELLNAKYVFYGQQGLEFVEEDNSEANEFDVGG